MRLLPILLLLCSAFGASAQETRDISSFAAWKEKNAADVLRFEAHLKALELSEVVELHQLLRSASNWKMCKSEPYAIPPLEQWESVVSVLRLLKELTDKKILGPFVIHSAYRGPALNECAGGAKRSAHVRSFAVDLSPIRAENPTAKLCNFWRKHGSGWHMGFSRYPSGRFHIDTSGYRTWGPDHTSRSSVCKSA